MRTYTIEIKAATLEDADLALAQVRKAIADGYLMAPWNPAGDDSEGNGFQFSSRGELQDEDGL